MSISIRPERGLVLIVDDDEDTTDLVTAWLGSEGWAVDVLRTGAALVEALHSAAPLLVLLDLELPDRSGLDVLEEVRRLHPSLAVVMLTANREVDIVVRAIQLGASDYVAKPFDRTRLLTAVTNAAERARLAERVRRLEAMVRGRAYRGIVGSSPAMERLFGELEHVVASDVSVLVRGQSGTGKELVAAALHQGGGRASGPFVAVNCAAIPEALVESELFGHERGAFTSASAQHRGCVERADRGTLFLDEIGELPMGAQAKLLRVLQERTFRRVGGSVEVRSDFRLVCATHRDLHELVEAGRFRDDFYYRIAVFELELPPLRERVGDVPLLVEHLVRTLSPERPVHVSDEAMASLEAYSWPGNVRELRNAIERALVLCRGSAIQREHLPSAARAPSSVEPDVSKPAATGTLEDIEREALRSAIERCGGNLSRVVRELGIGRATVYRKMKKYGLA